MGTRGTSIAAVLAVTAAMAAAVTGVAVSSRQAAAATTTFTPVADTYVQSNSATTNFGTAAQLQVDNSPVRRTFLRFTVSGVSEPITSVTLRLHVDNAGGAGSSVGGTVRLVSNTTWSETATTWNNQPAIDGATAGSFGAVSRNAWSDLDVTSAIPGNGTFSLAVTSTSNDGALYDSRETGTTAPQLVITTGTTTTSTTTTTTQPTTTTTQPTTTTTAPGGDPVMLGAGDIASCSSSGDEATAALLGAHPGTVFTTGDNVYDSGTASEFATCYDPSWGAYRARTRPAPGNHDYGTSGASGYFGYFGAAAGDPAKGYYSYDLGAWHIVSLNSNCSAVSCSAGGAQEQWLRADLAAHPTACVAAYWHHPRYSSGTTHGSSTATQALWQALYDANADLILEGHEHNYERFAPMTATGSVDTTRGIRSFVVGTGGRSHYSFGTAVTGSEVRNSAAWGVLQVTLHATSYDWQFLPVAGQSFTDSGTQACH